MSQHDPLVALRHMLDHAREAVDLAQGRSRDDSEGRARTSGSPPFANTTQLE
jgi:hypothetical protein